MSRRLTTEQLSQTPENYSGPFIIIPPDVEREFSQYITHFNPAKDTIDLREFDFSKVEYVTRGKAMAMPDDPTLSEKVPEFLVDLSALTGGDRSPVAKQFWADREKELAGYRLEDRDSLNERAQEVVPYLVHKYGTRVLMIDTTACAAMCRHCTRSDIVGGPMKYLPREAQERIEQAIRRNIDNQIQWIANNPEINEVILSGGDPLTMPIGRLEYILESLIELQNRGQLDYIRIGTRVPIHDPRIFLQERPHDLKKIIELVERINNFFLMLHINHYYELTAETIELLDIFRKHGHARLKSQTVLLRGINDSREVLQNTMRKITRSGIDPYYIFQDDEVGQARHFTVPITEGRELTNRFKKELSGIEATARYVIDAKDGHVKAPVEEGYWVDHTFFVDERDVWHRIREDGMGIRQATPEEIDWLVHQGKISKNNTVLYPLTR